MSEEQSNVGLGGWRLAMFARTVHVRHRCVRAIMEHGDIVADRGTIDAPGFYDKVARAYVRTIEAFEENSTRFHTYDEPVRFHTVARAVGRRWASRYSDVLRIFDANQEILCDGYFEAEEVDGDPRWLRTTGDPPVVRIHRSGVREEPPEGIEAKPLVSHLAEASLLWSELALAASEQLASVPIGTAFVDDPASLGCSDLGVPEPSAGIADKVGSAAERL